ncbi:hypothetical protein KY342_00125 [Candidatus Woesearchaeota archaeon]|nr:hypothetical protein [Candidatus Woesearchaeota archaeon]
MDKDKLLKKYGLEKPFKSWRKDKKKVVFVKNKDTKKIETIHYGQKGYSDYTIHKDKKRRKNFRLRHKCDEEKPSKLTARYWACEDLW